MARKTAQLLLPPSPSPSSPVSHQEGCAFGLDPPCLPDTSAFSPTLYDSERKGNTIINCAINTQLIQQLNAMVLRGSD